MIDLTVKTLDSQNHAFSLEDDQITVRGFKEHIAESVAVPADSQRLIYCGRVLQDEKKLNDYDVNGKVIHLVQRAPPQPGQRASDGAQNQGQNNAQPWMNEPGTHYRLTRTQMHGNALYVGAMSVPAEIMEGRGAPYQQSSNTLVSSRLRVVRQMFTRIQDIWDRFADPNRPPNPSVPENNQPFSAQQDPVETGQQVPEVETVHEHIFSNNDGGLNGNATIAEAAAFAIAAALSAAGANNFTVLRGNSDEGGEAGPPSDVNDDNQPDAQQQQQPQQQSEQGSASTNDEQSNRRSTPQQPLNTVMGELLQTLLSMQQRMTPHVQRYIDLMNNDPPLSAGSGPGGVEECQRVVDSVSESLHLMSHACHSLSDIIVNMDQEPPRQLQCRPLVLQHSAILQPGVPIQVEATISLHARNANNNNSGEGASDHSSAQSSSQSESPELNTDDTNQQQESGRTAQQQTEQQQTQSPFGIVFNLSNNVDVEMEVSPDGNIEVASGSGQTQSSENNNNNNNAGRTGGANSGAPPFTWWDSHLPPSLVRHLMHAVLGRRPQGGAATTTMTTPTAPPAPGQQSVVTSLDSGTTNAGQSTQARSNVGTHPTTATQTRSTSRPHVFHQHAHALGIGANGGDGHNFDIFLPCNSHHIRRTPPAAPNTITLMSQGTRSGQTPAPEIQVQTQAQSQSQSQPQTQTQIPTQVQTGASTTSSGGSTTNATASVTSQTNNNNPFLTLSQQILESAANQLQAFDPARRPGHIMQMFGGGNILVGIVEDRSGASIGNLTWAELLALRGITMDLFTSQGSGNEENFLVNLCAVVIQNVTVEGLIRLRIGQTDPIARLRNPLREFFQNSFPNTTPEVLQEQAADRLLSQLRVYIQNLRTVEEEGTRRSGPRIDICATVESLLRRHIKDALQFLFNNDVDDAGFGQEMLNIVKRLSEQLYTVLRYSVRGGQAGLGPVTQRFETYILGDIHPIFHQMINGFFDQSRYFSHLPQPPDSEIIPLLIYKDVPSEASAAPSAPVHPPSQPPSDPQPMETEVVEERTSTFEASLPDDGEEIPKTFPGHENLPSDWVPIIARDGVRQRRQLQMQGMANSGVTTFSDAYIGTLPYKRRKLIERQKPRLLFSPPPNRSAIATSLECLVTEGIRRAGIAEADGAAVAVAGDPGVRRAFGQAIRDCLNPCRYETPDFPDPLHFPNATKYFADQAKPPK